MKKLVYVALKIAVSALLLSLAVLTMQHGSSSGFEYSVFFVLLSIFHWALWPDIKVKNERE